jgi:predicted nucleotidyltransferase
MANAESSGTTLMAHGTGATVVDDPRRPRLSLAGKETLGYTPAGTEARVTKPRREVAAVLLKEKVAEIHRIARAHGVVRLRVFGSHALGVARETSDHDLLVDLEPERDLLDLAGFKLDLEDLLGCPVDVVTEAGLSPYLRDRILSETKPL